MLVTAIIFPLVNAQQPGEWLRGGCVSDFTDNLPLKLAPKKELGDNGKITKEACEKFCLTIKDETIVAVGIRPDADDRKENLRREETHSYQCACYYNVDITGAKYKANESTSECKIMQKAPQQNNCFRTNWSYVNPEGEDLNLQKIGGIKSAELCLKECQKIDECEEWTLNTKNHNCYTKKSGSLLVEKTVSTSGTKNSKSCDPWRNDLRCGTGFEAPSGGPAQCNPDNPDGFTCCSDGGWCGESRLHCSCNGCVDYSHNKSKWKCVDEKNKPGEITGYTGSTANTSVTRCLDAYQTLNTKSSGSWNNPHYNTCEKVAKGDWCLEEYKETFMCCPKACNACPGEPNYVHSIESCGYFLFWWMYKIECSPDQHI